MNDFIKNTWHKFNQRVSKAQTVEESPVKPQKSNEILDIYNLPTKFRDNQNFVNGLRSHSLGSSMDKIELMPYQAELIKLQKHLEVTGKKMIILFDGRDASGKGGTIRRVTRYMNEKHYRVVALGKPTERQKSELHMKRYIEQFPVAGEIVLFDRSWYNRAMVEPVFSFCTERQYQSFLEQVNAYEHSFLQDGDTYLIKLYFSVSKDEQKLRFDRRKNDPLRQWKLSEIDLQAQQYWDQFTDMKKKMLQKTSSEHAPWRIVRSSNKHLARLETIKVILNSIDYHDKYPELNYELNPEIILSAEQELALMSA